MINPFLDACGATGPVLLSTESPGGPGGETRVFDLPFVLAGRDPRSDLQLTHPDVSDRHAYFQVVDGQVLCIDLGSRLGVYQGGKCRRLNYLERDRPVRIGPYRVRLIGGDAEPASVLHAPGPPLPLELSHRGVRLSRCDLARGLALVGSASDCQIRLIDPSVSNYHCSLVHTPKGVWVVDLLGQGGVRVNDQDVSYAQFREGDSLRIGHSVVRLLAAAEDETPPADAAVSAHVPRSPHEPSADLVERVLGPMVSQVGQLQQQMVEEFQQARAMLFDTFAAFHQEQTAFLNQELDQIREISRELHDLRAELEQQTRMISEFMATAATASRLGSATPTPAPSRAIVVASSAAANRNGKNHAGHGIQATPATVFSRPEPDNGASQPRNEQAHVQLCLRIASLQKRQTSRWEKLLAIFPGMTPVKPPLPEGSPGAGA